MVRLKIVDGVLHRISKLDDYSIKRWKNTDRKCIHRMGRLNIYLEDVPEAVNKVNEWQFQELKDICEASKWRIPLNIQTEWIE
jgi:hypothetical protein